LAGNATLYDPPSYPDRHQPTSLEGRIVLTTDPVDYFQVALHGPRLVVYVAQADYAALRDRPGADFALRIQGQSTTHSSANVIGQITPATGARRKIILSAHLDAYPGSPGADDNASGLGVLIELARWFAARQCQVSCQLTFIAFGAEELAILGSRVYIERHAHGLQKCALALNLDQVGGNERPFIETLGGVNGVPSEPGQSQFPARFRNRALDGQDRGWRMIITPDLLAPMAVSNRPNWLVTTIQQAVGELGVEIEPTGNIGSDQQAFAQAGIVATGIGVGGNEVHTARDTPDHIHLPSLQVVGEIAARVTTKTMQKVGSDQ
jgi:acetylornithine deacetylase/succinyl-diaminopimelate desuccinylase-like protein